MSYRGGHIQHFVRSAISVDHPVSASQWLVWQRVLYRWEYAAAQKALPVTFKLIEQKLGNPKVPCHVVFANGAMTLAAWVIVLADACRLRQLPWTFSVTHTVPAVVNNAQKWTQWYPEITVIETAHSGYTPSLWPATPVVLSHSVIEPDDALGITGHWPTPWWLQWQWQKLPTEVTQGFTEPLPPGLHGAGHGLYIK